MLSAIRSNLTCEKNPRQKKEQYLWEKELVLLFTFEEFRQQFGGDSVLSLKNNFFLKKI